MPKKLVTRRDLVQLLHAAAELNVCPGCHDRDTWRELAPHADVLYAPDGTTPVACVDTNRFGTVQGRIFLTIPVGPCLDSGQKPCCKVY